MTEVAAVGAAQAAGTNAAAQVEEIGTWDSEAVAAFKQAMGAERTPEIPFAAQISETWGAAQANYQEMLHRIRSLRSMVHEHALSVAEMSELQYEVQNLTFQQEVVTNIAKKSTDAISTLVKNG